MYRSEHTRPHGADDSKTRGAGVGWQEFLNWVEPVLQFHVIPDIPLIKAGDDLTAILLDGLSRLSVPLDDGDVLVLAQKIVSKAEGRLIPLASVTPGPEAIALAAETDKDPRLVQLILEESVEVMRKKPGVLIMRHRLGNVGAHAGIDQSNIEHEGGECALLLPIDPDGSARRLRESVSAATGRRCGVIIADSMNRAWRLGTIGGAIGSAGLTVLDDLRGTQDLFGRELKVTVINRIDSLAATACLLMGESVQKTPAVLIKGLAPEDSTQTARDLVRPLAEDMFR
jgi:coenzyme F420-0:L-glutamate ligase/coenzyme F420-1:gamma-L-glutamate ligase